MCIHRCDSGEVPSRLDQRLPFRTSRVGGGGAARGPAEQPRSRQLTSPCSGEAPAENRGHARTRRHASGSRREIPKILRPRADTGMFKSAGPPSRRSWLCSLIGSDAGLLSVARCAVGRYPVVEVRVLAEPYSIFSWPGAWPRAGGHPPTPRASRLWANPSQTSS